MKKFTISLLVGLALAATVSAQSVDLASVEQVRNQDAMSQHSSLSPFGLIDLSKVKWSNSYSVSYFSGGGSSMSMGILSSAMMYEFSPKLSLTVNVGLLHNTGALVAGENTDPTVLPGFNLDYHPSDKFRLSLSVQTYRDGFGSDGSNYMNYGYYNRWRDPFYPY